MAPEPGEQRGAHGVTPLQTKAQSLSPLDGAAESDSDGLGNWFSSQ
jgi:hypothetical protein